MSELDVFNMLSYYRYIKKAKGKIEKDMEEFIRNHLGVALPDQENIFEIDGVPEREGENLGVIINMFLMAISAGFALEQVVAIERIQLRQPRPIIVAIKTKRVCDQVVFNASKYNEEHPENELNSNHLGFVGMKIPILVSGYPSELNKIHRQVVRSLVHRHIDQYHTILAGPAVIAPPAYPAPCYGASSSGLPTVPSLKELCTIALDNTGDEPEMTE